MKTLRVIVGFLGVVLPWAEAGAQSPIGPELRVNSETAGFQTNPSLAYDGAGRLAIAWDSFRVTHEETGEGVMEVFARRYSSFGEPLGEELVKTEASRPFVVAAGGEDFRILYGPGDFSGGLFSRRFSWATGQPVSVEVEIAPPGPQLLAMAATALPGGGAAAVWIGEDRPSDPGCVRCEYGAFARILDAGDEPVTGIFRVHDDTAGTQVPSGVAAGADGSLVVSWWGNTAGDGSEPNILARRFSAQGEALGGEIQVNRRAGGDQSLADVAVATDGGFVVAWQGQAAGGLYGIYAQRFDAAGEKAGPEIRVDTTPLADALSPRVAMDPSGNLLVVWKSFTETLRRWDVQGRLFRRDGTPAGPERTLTATVLADQEEPRAAFGPNGTCAVIWGASDDGLGLGVFAQRFSASPGDEPCVARGGRVSCDTGRTGGAAEIETVFGGRPGETLLLGDFDGDAREDLCARFGTRFRCDLDHRGAPAEAVLSFGLPADAALMGDLDGDGRDEPCVRRKRRFLCDTARDGGRAEAAVLFGAATDLPLLGDLDGDGRDDPCLFRNGAFLCDTAHDGGTAEAVLLFGDASDLPVLGDLDGDGRDDPCVLRGGRYLCDTAHDGGGAELELPLDSSLAGQPLIGNLDGL